MMRGPPKTQRKVLARAPFRVWCFIMFPHKWKEYGFGYIIIRSPYTPYSIYLRGTILELVLAQAVLVSLA